MNIFYFTSQLGIYSKQQSNQIVQLTARILQKPWFETVCRLLGPSAKRDIRPHLTGRSAPLKGNLGSTTITTNEIKTIHHMTFTTPDYRLQPLSLKYIRVIKSLKLEFLHVCTACDVCYSQTVAEKAKTFYQNKTLTQWYMYSPVQSTGRT